MQFFCIGSLEMMANALAIVWTARALQTGGFNEAKQTKNVISVHTVHARTSPVHARMVRLVRTHLAQQNRSDNTLPRAEPSKSQARVHKKFGVIPLIFNEMRELHFLHGLARDVDVWSPCMPVAPDEKRLVFLTVTPQKCSFFASARWK